MPNLLTNNNGNFLKYNGRLVKSISLRYTSGATGRGKYSNSHSGDYKEEFDNINRQTFVEPNFTPDILKNLPNQSGYNWFGDGNFTWNANAIDPYIYLVRKFETNRYDSSNKYTMQYKIQGVRIMYGDFINSSSNNTLARLRFTQSGIINYYASGRIIRSRVDTGNPIYNQIIPTKLSDLNYGITNDLLQPINALQQPVLQKLEIPPSTYGVDDNRSNYISVTLNSECINKIRQGGRYFYIWMDFNDLNITELPDLIYPSTYPTPANITALAQNEYHSSLYFYGGTLYFGL